MWVGGQDEFCQRNVYILRQWDYLPTNVYMNLYFSNYSNSKHVFNISIHVCTYFEHRVNMPGTFLIMYGHIRNTIGSVCTYIGMYRHISKMSTWQDKSGTCLSINNRTRGLRRWATRETIVFRCNKLNPTKILWCQVRNSELFGTSVPTSQECVNKNSERYFIQSWRYPKICWI